MAVDNPQILFDEIKRIATLSNDGYFIYHLADSRLIFLNGRMAKIAEINKKLLLEEPDIILRSLPEVDLEYLKSRFAELLDNAFIEDVEFRFSNHNSTKTLSCSAYLSSDNCCVIGRVRDISKLKQHEDYLVNFGARKDAILDMVSQNLSTPLNLARFTVDLIDKAVEEKRYHKLKTHVELMREVTADCIKIIDKFLVEEHMESPRIDVKAKRFDAIAKILIVLEKLKELNPKKRLKFKSVEKHLFITGDDTKFFQVIHNLLSNAMKFTVPEGNVETIVKNHPDRIQVIIKDDGIGIPDDLKPFVFQKKSRARRTGLHGETSNGVGLYVARQLTGMMNGKISFESEENKGTVFTVELPKQP